jgi:stalled ribosome alternative rescue factor ArfA
MTNASIKSKVEKKKKKKGKGGYQDEVPYEISRFQPVLRKKKE